MVLWPEEPPQWATRPHRQNKRERPESDERPEKNSDRHKAKRPNFSSASPNTRVTLERFANILKPCYREPPRPITVAKRQLTQTATVQVSPKKSKDPLPKSRSAQVSLLLHLPIVVSSTMELNELTTTPLRRQSRENNTVQPLQTAPQPPRKMKSVV